MDTISIIKKLYVPRGSKTQHRSHRDEEHRIQVACVNWYRIKYSKFKHCLFAVPNGGKRDERTGAILKAEGAMPGVSDLILLKSNSQYSALCIEMKTETGKQSRMQKEWQKAIEQEGVKYVVCRSLDDFIKEVNDYFKNL